MNGHPPDVQAESSPPRRRRFSVDSANDLLFWSIHFAIVAISLGIVWTKLNSTTEALRAIITAQNAENASQATQLALARHQAELAEKTATDTEKIAAAQAMQLRLSQAAIESVLEQVQDIAKDVDATLEKSTQTNSLLLSALEGTKAAALGAESAASQASRAASGAAGAAQKAASLSGRTAGVVASKVVTTQDKQRIKAEQAQLAAKNQQLSKTIQKVKKNGPSVWQQIFH